MISHRAEEESTEDSLKTDNQEEDSNGFQLIEPCQEASQEASQETSQDGKANKEEAEASQSEEVLEKGTSDRSSKDKPSELVMFSDKLNNEGSEPNTPVKTSGNAVAGGWMSEDNQDEWVGKKPEPGENQTTNNKV